MRYSCGVARIPLSGVSDRARVGRRAARQPNCTRTSQVVHHSRPGTVLQTMCQPSCTCQATLSSTVPSLVPHSDNSNNKVGYQKKKKKSASNNLRQCQVSVFLLTLHTLLLLLLLSKNVKIFVTGFTEYFFRER